MKHNPYIYIFIMFGISYLIRALPITLIRREIRNRTIRSFLSYVPSETLSVMTFPAIVSATGSTAAGMLALAAGIICAWFGAGLFPVAAACSTVVFIAGFFL